MKPEHNRIPHRETPTVSVSPPVRTHARPDTRQIDRLRGRALGGALFERLHQETGYVQQVFPEDRVARSSHVSRGS